MSAGAEIDYRSIPPELRSRPQWVLWGVDQHNPKAPRQPRFPQRGAAANDPATWGTFEDAQAAYLVGDAPGIGYEITPADGLVFLDFDHCLTEAGELLEPFASWRESLPGYWELSQSGTGLHGFVRGTLPAGCRHKQHIKPGSAAAVEMYTGGRYCALTGALWGPQTALDCAQSAQPGIDAILAQLGMLPAGSAAAEAQNDALDRPADEVQAIMQEALQRDADFARLYSNKEHYGDESEQDHALVCAAYRATQYQLSGADLWAALTASPWAESKDAKHLRKWQRGDYQRRTLAAAYQAAKEKDAAAVQGFAPVLAVQPQFFTAAELEHMELPPVRWAVPGLLPAGFALLVAAPKIGKSWMALDLCLAVASGGEWLGHKVNRGAALYLALEDSQQRLKSRVDLLSDGFTPWPAYCTMTTTAPPLGEGLLEMLDRWLAANPDAKLICVDTFQRIRPPAGKNENAYSADYRVCAPMQQWAMQRGICLLLVHHTRKTVNPADVFDSISGSTGLFGVADATLVITKDGRFNEAATLSVTGRDVDADEYKIRFDKDAHRWQLLGTAEEQARQELATSPAVLTAKELTAGGEWRGTVQQLADEVLARYPDTDIPTSPQGLGRYFAAVWPALKSVDIEHAVCSDGKNRKHTLNRVKQAAFTRQT